MASCITMLSMQTKRSNRPLSRGGHFESQGNKKLCFCTASLALNERLDVQNLLFEHCVIKVYFIVTEIYFKNIHVLMNYWRNTLLRVNNTETNK